MLSIQNISKTFNPGTVNEKTALHDFSLNPGTADFVSIIGRMAPASPRCSTRLPEAFMWTKAASAWTGRISPS